MNRASVRPVVCNEPLLHGVLHLWTILIGVSTLSTNHLEQVVLSISNVWCNTATKVSVIEIFLDLSESISSQLKSFFAANDVQVNTLWWSFLFNNLRVNLLSHVEFIGLRIFRVF